MPDQVKKCLVCRFVVPHKFKDCFSPQCECNCLSEIRGEMPLPFEECPKWFRCIPLKSTRKFNRAHTKEGC